MQAQESGDESEEPDEEEEQEEGEVMIISPPKLTCSQGHFMPETSFLGLMMDDNVDSFSTVFTPSISTSEFDTSTFSISSTAPSLLTIEQN